ncbi:hypothetical protein TruAng_009021 [Truncatella angustata]|nr:hypothetical protein TruAng_009021 [Truncatella angustata]
MGNIGISSIYNFPTEFVANLHVLRNGTLLLSMMELPTGLLYTLDPTALNPRAKVVATFDSNITALTGVPPLPGYDDDDLYTVSGGLHTSFAFERGSMSVYIVSLNTGTIVDSIPVPDTATMNGTTVLPYEPSNSGLGVFVRVRIDDFGNPMGDFDVLARSPDATQILFCQ